MLSAALTCAALSLCSNAPLWAAAVCAADPQTPGAAQRKKVISSVMHGNGKATLGCCFSPHSHYQMPGGGGEEGEELCWYWKWEPGEGEVGCESEEGGAQVWWCFLRGPLLDFLNVSEMIWRVLLLSRSLSCSLPENSLPKDKESKTSSRSELWRPF